MKKFPLCLAVVAVAFSSCAPSTPQARIEKSPEKFSSLNKENKELVKQGLITRGMSPDAVELAWGKPSRIIEGSSNSKPTERWEYAGVRPAYWVNHTGGYGYGMNGFSQCGYGSASRVGFGLDPELVYVPYRVASVGFVNHRVESWEKVR